MEKDIIASIAGDAVGILWPSLVLLDLSIYDMSPSLTYKNVKLAPFISLRVALQHFTDREMAVWLHKFPLSIDIIVTILKFDRENILWLLLRNYHGENVRRVFDQCVKFGKFELLKFVAKKYKINNIWNNNMSTLEFVIISNRLDILIWLNRHSGLNRRLVLFNNGILIASAVRLHRLRILKWLTTQFGFALTDSFHGTSSLVIAAECGYFDILQWAIEHSGISRENCILANIMTAAFENDNLCICQWLIEKFDLGADWITGNDASCWRYAIMYGRLRFLKWANERFALDALPSDAHIRVAILHNHIEICKWLIERFNLTRQDIIQSNNSIFISLAMCYNMKTVNWVANKFQLVSSDISAPMFIRNLASHRYCQSSEFAEQFVERFALGEITF